MRPAVIAVAIAIVAICLAACSSSEEAGWTYAPPPTEVAASGAPSGVPGSPAPSTKVSPAPSEAPSAPPSAPASAAPSGSAPASAPASAAGGEVVTVTAQNITFEQADLEVAAGKPFTLELVNNDASVPHNVEIRDRAGTPVFKTDTFPGVETRSFDAPALAAGAYQFACTVHPNMIIDVNAT
jgi:plastocyanin